MERLILMRHAKAEKRSASGGDFERALTDQGRADAAIMAALLAREGLGPDLALVSAARRTEETWEAMSPAFPAARKQALRGLYNASAATLLEAAEGADGKTVLVVAHNPGVHELTVRLLGAAGAGGAVLARATGRFPTATAAAFMIDQAGRPSYDGLFFVAEHGGGGQE